MPLRKPPTARASVLLLLFTLTSMNTSLAPADDLPRFGEDLSDKQVAAFAQLVLAGVEREYPNKPAHVLTDPQSVRPPRELHPAFYGCFDWHSSVHGHWMLIRLLKCYPDCSTAQAMRDLLNRHLTAENMKREAAYFDVKENRSFERMYGWAWALRLAAELHAWDDRDGNIWRENIQPLEGKIVELTKDYLPRLSFPIRTGVHPDTAFALGQALDYARIVKDEEFEQLIEKRGREYYLEDKDYPAAYEPSGEDFFSPGLNEADLMRRILPAKEFSRWLDHFLPGLSKQAVGTLLEPVEVSDVTDGKLVHLAGLDLSRAWALRGISAALADGDPRRRILRQAAGRHAEMGYRYVFSGHYEGEHWLATFAIYAHTGVSVGNR